MNLSRWLTVMICTLSAYGQAEQLKMHVNAESAILINAESGAILYEKNAHTLHFPASTTKIATAIYTLEVRETALDDEVIAEQESIAMISEEAKKRANYILPSYWIEDDSTHIGIKKGEKFSLRDLLYGMMLRSGNDASNVIAQHVGGTVPNFMEELNAFLLKKGCINTHFTNPHGLHHPKHQTTAFDLATLTRIGLQNPLFCKIVSTVRYPKPKTNKQEASVFVNSNKLLKPGKFYYQKAIGIKTGYTSAAQNTFVGAAKQGDRVLIAVLLKTKEREDMFKDSIRLFNAAFDETKEQRIVLTKGGQTFVLQLEGAVEPIKTTIHEDVSLEYYPSEEPFIKCTLCWDPLTPPIAKGQRVGELTLQTSQGLIVQKVPLYAQEDVKMTWSYWLNSLLG